MEGSDGELDPAFCKNVRCPDGHQAEGERDEDYGLCECAVTDVEDKDNNNRNGSDE